MKPSIISVENLCKRYYLGQIGADTLRESTERFIQKLKGTFTGRSLRSPSQQFAGPTAKNSPAEFWALRDVSFEVQRGEVLGIIGYNGAGKSTVLKILSRISEPTGGRAVIRGRVASLLEVGTGFHPELTGRENIFLNGAILGMRHAEIARKFDEIVAFAEVNKFIDTPVKHYSSGMYVRLAFAVAAHLEPEILVVDEVLAVGDSSFQKKCMRKMGEVSKEGRTILFVSHNMAAVSALCSRVVLLEKGRVIADSTPETVVKQYLVASNTSNGSWVRSTDIPADAGIYFEHVIVQDASARCVDHFSSGEPVDIVVAIVVTSDFDDGQIAIRFTNEEGVAVFTSANTDWGKKYTRLSRGKHNYRVRIPRDFLACGHYNLIVASMIPGRKLFDTVNDSVGFSIEDTGTHASVLRDGRLGIVTPVFEWHES